MRAESKVHFLISGTLLLDPPHVEHGPIMYPFWSVGRVTIPALFASHSGQPNMGIRQRSINVVHSNSTPPTRNAIPRPEGRELGIRRVDHLMRRPISNRQVALFPGLSIFPNSTGIGSCEVRKQN